MKKKANPNLSAVECETTFQSIVPRVNHFRLICTKCNGGESGMWRMEQSDVRVECSESERELKGNEGEW